MKCKFYRWIIENELDTHGSVRKPRVLEHIEKCPSCRAFYDQWTSLGKQLMTQPAGEVDDNRILALQTKISHHLDRSIQQAGIANHRFTARSLTYHVSAIAAGVVMAVFAGLLINYFEGKPVQADPFADVRQSQQFGTEITLQTPLPVKELQNEFQKLEGDAKNALNFLKQFAPSSPVELASIEEDNSSDETIH